MDFGLFSIDLDKISFFFAGRQTFDLVTDIFAIGGWLVFAYLLLFAGLELLQEYREDLYKHHWKWVLLAIDIPMLNVQTPKAVEQLFAHLAGAYDTANLAKKYVHGYKQRWFSFEIVSIDGYIQFLIRTEELFRDLVEAAVFAQYPDAEIIEVEDYVNSVPDKYPNNTHEMWAADFALSAGDSYPIRTYREFEHSISKDTVLKDPMGTLLESFSRIGPGEQMWLQIVVEPTGNSWKDHVIEEVKKLIGDESHGHGHGGAGSKILGAIGDAPVKVLSAIGDQLFPSEGGHEDAHKEKTGPLNNIQFLTPGQKVIVEGMEAKISKLGFKTKMRAVYVARKEVFAPQRGVNALIGAINQFNIPSANSIVPAYTPDVSYFLKKQRIAYRKAILMGAYKKRKVKAGGNPFILNIEELATIWHFPMSHVKTPMVQKSLTKQAEPPASLPVETVLPPAVFEEGGHDTHGKSYTTDSGEGGYSEEQKFG